MNYTDYETVIYSGNAKNKLKVKINNIEQIIDNICEKMTVKSMILPDDSSNVFSLNNLISKEVTLIIHQQNSMGTIAQNIPVEISIGTLIDNDYEFVKIGVFNVQDLKIDDKGKTTIKLRDNSVKLDFNYNAKEVIDLNGGKATLMQILQDICTKAQITTDILSFNGDDIEVSIYDNTIKARQYIAFIAEQAGAMPIITRDGKLDFIYLNNLNIVNVPLNVVEKYKIGDTYKISKVVYQDATRDFQIGDNTANKLYLSSANPYIIDAQQVSDVNDIVNGFEIQSCSTERVLGNPKIDAYDIIRIIDENNNIVFETLGNNTLEYKGVMTMKFSTSISNEKMKENISTRGEATFQKWVRSQFDNVEGSITLQAGQIETLNGEIGDVNDQITEQNQKINSVEETITATNATISVISTNIDAVTGDILSIANTIGKFDQDGLSIDKSSSQVKSKLDEAGLEIDDKSSGSDKMEFYSGFVDNEVIQKENTLSDYEGKTVTYTKDIIVKEYIAMPNGRFENVEDTTHGKGIGLFI